jgi:hypothetical protein
MNVLKLRLFNWDSVIVVLAIIAGVIALIATKQKRNTATAQER